jgi:hypothetical protein
VSASARSTSRPAKKVIGSIGVLAAAAAIAGTGTFGAFTDSTAALDSQVASGTVSIDLAAPARVISFPDVGGGLLPGDTSHLLLDLVNTGTTDLSTVTADVTALQSSLLDSDTTSGLQVDLASCDEAWSTDTGAYTCDGVVTDLYDGPVLFSQQLAGAASLRAGGVDHLLATVTLPQTAGNAFMGARSDLGVLLTGAQRGGTAR